MRHVKKSVFIFSITVVLSSFIVNVGSSIRHKIYFKTAKLMKEMPDNCVYEEYG